MLASFVRILFSIIAVSRYQKIKCEVMKVFFMALGLILVFQDILSSPLPASAGAVAAVKLGTAQQ